MENTKFENLLTILKNMQRVLLAYSGGVDSTFLMKAIHVAGIPALSVTAASEFMPTEEVAAAQEMANALGINHRILTIAMLSRDELASNTPERCYFCKDRLYRELESIALEEGYPSILDGSTPDDMAEFRPGRRAAEQHRVRSPLREADLTKNEIREISRQLGLSTWNKPSSPCLATRFPYGQRITREALSRVEKAEHYLRSIGFRELRVRDHGSLARIEVGPEEIVMVLEARTRAAISAALKSLGYAFISLDLDGYRSGSMDRTLEKTS